MVAVTAFDESPRRKPPALLVAAACADKFFEVRTPADLLEVSDAIVVVPVAMHERSNVEDMGSGMFGAILVRHSRLLLKARNRKA